MDVEAALKLATELIFAQTGKTLNDLPSSILRGGLEGKTFNEIAELCHCDVSHAKKVSLNLCKHLSTALGVEIGKLNLRSALEERLRIKKQMLLAKSSTNSNSPYENLSGDKAFPKQVCSQIGLYQKMRDWFEALDYNFEKYEVCEYSYFEWVIQIPLRGSRYNRILVRGIEGEVKRSDVIAVQKSVKAQNTDEGWLVSERRISQPARNEVSKKENSHLRCYTFDELLDEDADFSSYLNWLEAEVKSRGIDKKYVPLACTKEEIDSLSLQQIGVSLYSEKEGWIDGYIDLWLDDPAKEHISILGEFGTGKTWFAFHYAWTALQRYRDAQKRGVERPRLPIVITLRDFAKALNVGNVLAGFFFTQHNIRINSKVFDQLNRMGKLLLIFDGFDEMAAKIDRQQMINNFWELAKVVVRGAKVILTCRTEHFPEATEGRALLNAELQASTSNLTGEAPQFEVLELEKFDDDQIRKVLSFQAEPATVEQVMGNPQLLDLARRPVMNDFILEALPDIKAGKPVDISRVFLYAVKRKMQRDIKEERTFTSLADKLYFLSELSWEMLSTDQMSLNYKLFPSRLRRLFGSILQNQNDLDHWHYDMMGQTMLVRNTYGDYTPAHRSLLEFFVAYKLAAEIGDLADDFTDLAREQSYLNMAAAPIDYTWSNYFIRQLNASGLCLTIPPLKEFVSEPLVHLKDTFGKIPLTKAVMDLILPMLGNKLSLIKLIESTRGKSDLDVAYTGGNAATLLMKLDKRALLNKDLSRTVIKGADFTDANLCDVNFTNANLADSVFAKVLGNVLSVAFSPDGKLFATGDSNGVVSLWDSTSRRKILTLKGHTNWLQSVTFSPDGKTLASSSVDQTVRLWNIQSGKCFHIFHGHADRVRAVAFSPDGHILATCGADQTVRLWNIHSGECFHILHGHAGWVQSVAFSPDSQIVASASLDQTVRLWNVQSGQCTNIFHGHSNWVNSAVAFSPNGKTLASTGDKQTVLLWNIHSGECLHVLQGHAGWIQSVAFSPDGKTLASASDDRTVRLWNVYSCKCLYILHGHTNWVQSVAFSPDGKTLASAGNDQTVRLWNVQSSECSHILHGYSNWVNSVTFSPDGKTLASVSDDQTVRLWNVQSGKCFCVLHGHTHRVRAVTFSPDGKTLASASADQTVRLWNIQSGECFHILRGHTPWVQSVAFSPDGKTVASASDDQTVRLWNVQSGECFYVFNGHTNRVRTVAFSPDGKTLASAGADGVVLLWNAKSGKCFRTFQGHANWVNSVAFSPDGQTLVSGSNDQTVRLWNVKSGKCLHTLLGHANWVSSVAFSSDGQTLASASVDRMVRLWNIHNGKSCHTLQGHANWIQSVAFSPDGQTLASGDADGMIIFWYFETGKYFKTLRNERPYERMNITGVAGLTEAEIASLKILGAIIDQTSKLPQIVELSQQQAPLSTNIA